MKDFIYYAPTQVVFGALSEDKTGKLVKQYGGTKVLVHYGGQSAERSGLLDKICRALEAEGQSMQDAAAYIKNAPCGNTNHCRCWDWIWKMKKMN